MQEVTLDWLPATGTLSNPLNRWPILTHHWLLPPPLVCPCDGMRILHPTQHEAQGDCWGSPSGRDHLWMYANADSTCTEVFWILPWIFQGYRSNVYCSVNSLDPKVPEELFSLIQFYKANKVTCREFSPSMSSIWTKAGGHSAVGIFHLECLPTAWTTPLCKPSCLALSIMSFLKCCKPPSFTNLLN